MESTKTNFLLAASKVDTPSIIYNLDTIDYMIHTIKKHTSDIPNLDLFFSVKANRFAGVLKEIEHLNLGVDVASLHELEAVKQIGFSKIHATSPSFSTVEIDTLYDEGIIPDFNSIGQLEQWCKYRKNRKIKDIGLRLKVNISDHLKHDTVSDENSRFGINANDPKLFELIEKYQLNVRQLHIHMGEYRNSTIAKEVIAQVKRTLNLFEKIDSINFGGGLTYLYSNQNEVEKFWNSFREFSIEIFEKRKRTIEFIFEPGMLITVASGYLVSKVLYIDKINAEKYNVVLDSSAWSLFTWSPIRLVSQISKNNGTVKKYKISGSSCYEADVFIEEISLDELSVGDRLIFGYSGAYVSSMMRNMHGFNKIREYILKDQVITEG